MLSLTGSAAGPLPRAPLASLARGLTCSPARVAERLLGVAHGLLRVAELLVVGDLGVVEAGPRRPGRPLTVGDGFDVRRDAVETPLEAERERVGFVEEGARIDRST